MTGFWCGASQVASATRRVPLADGVVWGDWRFVEQASAGPDTWSAELGATDGLFVRAWRPGDRMIPAGSSAPRRVKGLFRDAGIDAVQPTPLAGGRGG